MEMAPTGQEETAVSISLVIESGCFLTKALKVFWSSSKVSGATSGQVLQPIHLSWSTMTIFFGTEPL